MALENDTTPDGPLELPTPHWLKASREAREEINLLKQEIQELNAKRIDLLDTISAILQVVGVDMSDLDVAQASMREYMGMQDKFLLSEFVKRKFEDARRSSM